jgi:formylglycine-generating enzyme required for sulfatase activity
LSQEEGLTKCYPDKIVPGGSMEDNWRDRDGYRLPTKEEWEYACRAKSVSARFYGSSDTLLPKYSWFSGNAKQMNPPALLKPNDFGLFDILGNAYEWVHDPIVGEADRQFSDMTFRVIRGGSFIRPPPFHTSGKGEAYRTYERSVLGFRVVRTWRER